jgi:archaellum component FlaF (FlaF/FlaG flagellin family)
MISGIIDSNQKIVSNGLIFNYDAAQIRSYPTTGTNWFDLSGNSRTAVLNNGASYNSGNGGRIVLDGTNDFVNTGTGLPLSNVSQFSYSTFINFITCAGTFGAFFNYGVNGQFTNDILFAWFKSSKQLVFQINNGVDGSANYVYIPSSAWVNISVVYNGSLSTNANKLKVYINGVQITLDFNTYNVPSTTGSPSGAGSAFGYYIPAPVGSYYAGNIATASLYNRALTDAEVGQNFNAIKSRFGL